MNVLTRIAVAATIATGFFAVAAPSAEAQNTAYFPMHVGDHWTYSESGALASHTPGQVSVDAQYFSPTSGRTWFRVRGYQGDYHWLWQTTAARVYEWPATHLWYRLGLAAGTPWDFSIDASGTHGAIACSDGAQCEVVSRSEPLTVPAGTFSTIHIRWTVHCFDAGITDEWFASGVGLVRRDHETIAGPVLQVLESAVVGGKTIGAPAASAFTTSVSTDQAGYYENHMPGPGPRPTQGPQISVACKIVTAHGQPVTLHTADYNVWKVTIVDPSGNVVYSNPMIMAPAPAGGVSKSIPGAGDTATFPVHFAFGSPQGTYTVKARCLSDNPIQPEVSTTFSYSYVY